MPGSVNRQWLLTSRPVGLPKASDFEYREVGIPEPGKGEILLQILYALMDPAQRGWMDAGGNYWDPSPLGEPMRSGIIAKVVKSNSDQHPVGQFVMGVGGWQDFVVAPEGTASCTAWQQCCGDGDKERGDVGTQISELWQLRTDSV